MNARGIRADEIHRAKASNDNRTSHWHPLADAGTTRADVARFWSSQPFDLRLPDVGGANPFGNCDGCFLKSEARKALLCRFYPDRAEWWERKETEFNATFRDGQPISKTRKMVEDQGDWIFDDKDFLCQKDGGECHD